MKLYAHVRSDRATKSQGGNNFIEIELLVGDKTNPQQFAVINLARTRGDVSHLDIKSYELTVVTEQAVNIINSKGEKQKGNCKECGEPLYGTVRVHHHTENGVDVTQ